MIGRVWKARVAEHRVAEYEAFAREVSLPMFRLQPGFRGVAMFRKGDDCMVLTFWQDAESVAALTRSDAYARTVNVILAKGFLDGEQTVETFNAHLLSDLPASRAFFEEGHD